MSADPRFVVDLSDRQAILNYVYTHFITNKAPPSLVKSSGQCVYKGPNGARCAFAVLFTNPDDPALFEGLVASSILGKLYEEDVVPVAIARDNFFNDLQKAHDQAAKGSDSDESFRNYMAGSFVKLASTWNLVSPS